MPFTKNFIKSLITKTDDATAASFRQSKERLRTNLTTQTEDIIVRFYACYSPGYGHYSNTLHLLERFLELINADTHPAHLRIEVVYNFDEEHRRGDFDKYRMLIPGLISRHDVNPVTIMGSPIYFTPINIYGAPLRTMSILSFIGGFDNKGERLDNCLRTLNTTNCLILQPYRWDYREVSQSAYMNKPPTQNEFEKEFIDDLFASSSWLCFGWKKRQINKFSNLSYLFTESFFDQYNANGRQWYINNTPEPDPDPEPGDTPPLCNIHMIRIANGLIDNKDNVSIWPVYGIHAFGTILDKASGEYVYNHEIEIMVFGLVTAAFQYLRAKTTNKHVVMLLPLKFAEESRYRHINGFVRIRNLFNNIREGENAAECLKQRYRDLLDAGEFSYVPDDQPEVTKYLTFLTEVINDIKQGRNWMNDIGRIDFREDVAEGDVAAFINTITHPAGTPQESRLYVLLTGDMPRPFFSKLFRISDLPPVFEGQGTTSMMLCTGRPFLQFRKNCADTLNNYDFGGIKSSKAKELMKLADTIPKPTSKSVTQLKDFLSNNPDHMGVFTSYRTWANNERHDKFMVGLIAVADYIPFQRAEILNANARLESIYALLKELTDQSRPVDIYECFEGYRLTELFKSFSDSLVFSKNLKLERINDDKGELAEVILSAEGLSMQGVEFNAVLTFKYEFKELVSALECVSADSLTFAGLSWISLSNMGFQVLVSEDGVRLVGAFSGVISSIGLKVSIPFPFDNKWTIVGKFDDPVSPTDVFELCGGLDFTSAFPQFFSVLNAVGVSELGFVYDHEENVLDEIFVEITTKEKWVIVNDPELSIKPELLVRICDPLSFNERHAIFELNGELEIGGGTVSVTGRYPDFYLRGELTDGEINFGTLVKMFGSQYEIEALNSLAITQFLFEAEPEAEKLSVECFIENESWEIGGVFKITGLSLNVYKTRSGLYISVGGSFMLLPNSLIKVTVMTEFGTGFGWKVRGDVAIGGGCSVTELIGHYSENQLSINQDEPNLPLASISLSVSKDGNWEFSGGISEPWKLPFLESVSVTANLRFGKKTVSGVAQYEAYIWTDWSMCGCEIEIWYCYSGAALSHSFGITWEGIQAVLENNNGVWKAGITLTSDITLGWMVAKMLSWFTGMEGRLDPPWDILDEISLEGCKLEYNFKTKEIGVKLERKKPISLGFATIDGITLNYKNSDEEKGVFITLNGSFVWQREQDLSWDASKPGSAPVPPGGGNKYFNLTLLGLGQHIELPELANAKTVDAAIVAVKSIEAPSDEKPPQMIFSENSSWLFATELELIKLTGAGETGYMINFQAVFNDPNLYAARLRLKGAAAKIFKGLDVQILYRKINDTTGVFKTEITLPDVMRYLTIGAYSITIPIFGVAIYTNGDFMIDIGFPWNRDFSRSLSIEAIIPPGIPITGAAGLYFGKLSSDTAEGYVPVTTKGMFNPVTVFGFGIRAGVGKSVQYGILKAGFSLTLLAIIEGVMAKWNPYLGSSGSDESEYYHKLSGVIGISGKLFGTVDFAIIKADVNINLEVTAQFTFEAYRKSVITVLAQVSVRAGITINLFIVKIRINFSFSLTVKESFTIGCDDNAPWDEKKAPVNGRLRAPVDYRLSAPAIENDITLNWGNLLPAGEGERISLNGWIGATPIMAGDEWKREGMLPCMVVMLLLKDGEGQFSSLCEMAARWLAAASQREKLTKTQTNQLIIKKTVLDSILEKLLAPTVGDSAPISADDADGFMNGQFSMLIPEKNSSYNADSDNAAGVYFPIPGGVSVYAGNAEGKGISYDFASYNQVSTEKLAQLRELFNKLAVFAEEGREKSPGASVSRSMSNWVYADYFLFLIRQMAQAMRDQLRNFKYSLTGRETPDGLVAWIKDNGCEKYELYDIFAANSSHKLSPGQRLTISEGTYITKDGDTLASVSLETKTSMEDLAQEDNGKIAGLFSPEELLDIPHLESFKLGEILESVRRSGVYDNLPGVISRYHLHGLRITADGITPNFQGMWVEEGRLPAEAGIYALTGQQIRLPKSFEKEFIIRFKSSVEWLKFENGAYSISIKQNSRTAVLVNKLAEACGNIASWVPDLSIDYRNMYTESPAACAFANPVNFSTDAPILLPYADAANDAYSLWSLPPGIKCSEDGEPARCTVKLGEYDEATGKMISRDPRQYGWASTVRLNIKRLETAVPGATSSCTYTVTGITCSDILESILLEAPLIEKIMLGCASSLDAVAAETQAVFYLMRSNLSTDSNPPPAVNEDGEILELEDANRVFVRMLWEAGVTNSGGYYLFYSQSGKQAGLPEAIFDKDGAAEITIVILFAPPSSGIENRLYNYINNIIIERQTNQAIVPYCKMVSGKRDIGLTVSTGVASVGLARPAVTEPEEIVTGDDAVKFLLNRYSLLGYRIVNGGGFDESPFGLPSGPFGEAEWEYRLAVPYIRFLSGGEPVNPYIAVGRELTFRTWWQDIFGNAIGTNWETESVIMTSYSDSLPGLSEWPGLSVSYLVDALNGQAVIRVLLGFDGSAYLNPVTGPEKSLADLKKYMGITNQLRDPHGISISVGTTILGGDTGIELTEDQAREFNNWLSGDEFSITDYLEKCARGETASVRKSFELVLPLDPGALNTANLYEVSCVFTVARKKAYFAPGLEKVNNIKSAVTVLLPLFDTQENGETRSISNFARKLEAALPQYRLMADSGTKSLWALRQGPEGVGFEFKGTPVQFAVRPLHNTLQNSNGPIPIYEFDKSTGLKPNPAAYKTYVGIDTETWLRRILFALEDALSPERIGWIKALDTIKKSSYLDDILKLKQSFASNLKNLVVPTFEDQLDEETGYVREVAYQELLKNLTGLYLIKSIIRCEVEVSGGIPAPEGFETPKFYGLVSIASGDKLPLSLTSARFPAKEDETQHTAFILMGPEITRDESGSVIPRLKMSPVFNGAHIEHTIRSLEGINNYKASSWLSFVTSRGADDNFRRPMGQVETPLFIRSYPDNPSLEKQMYSEAGAGDLEKLLSWDYSFVYSLPAFYPQDTAECFVVFNEARQVTKAVSENDVMTAFAQFMETYPAVESAMNAFSNEINIHMKPDHVKIKEAEATLGALLTLFGNAAAALDGGVFEGGPGISGITIRFSVREGAENIDGTQAFVIYVCGNLPDGFKIPEIHVSPEEYEARVLEKPDSDPASVCYYYVNRRTGEMLAPADGQRIGERYLALPGLNMIALQSARAGMYISRNKGLIENRDINDAFIYTTGEVCFDSPCYVARDLEMEIDLITSQAKKKRRIREHLQGFFNELLKSAESGSVVTLQAEAVYARTVNKNLSPVELPVFMQPAEAFALEDINNMCAKWSGAINEWHEANFKEIEGGSWDISDKLYIDLTLFSSLSAEPMQMLRLRRLVLGCQYILAD